MILGGEQRRNQEFRFRFRQCRYRNFWQEKTGKFVNLWIDFREDIFPVYFYSESESYSLKSIQRITNSLAFSCQKFRYRHCRNRNRNSWFLLCSPPNWIPDKTVFPGLWRRKAIKSYLMHIWNKSDTLLRASQRCRRKCGILQTIKIFCQGPKSGLEQEPTNESSIFEREKSHKRQEFQINV